MTAAVSLNTCNIFTTSDVNKVAREIVAAENDDDNNHWDRISEDERQNYLRIARLALMQVGSFLLVNERPKSAHLIGYVDENGASISELPGNSSLTMLIKETPDERFKNAVFIIKK